MLQEGNANQMYISIEVSAKYFLWKRLNKHKMLVFFPSLINLVLREFLSLRTLESCRRNKWTLMGIRELSDECIYTWPIYHLLFMSQAFFWISVKTHPFLSLIVDAVLASSKSLVLTVNQPSKCLVILVKSALMFLGRKSNCFHNGGLKETLS